MDETNSFISNFESKDARRLFIKILLFIPVLLLVLTVNLCLDPEGLYRNTVDKFQTDKYRIVQTLASGKTVLIDYYINGRLLRKYMIENTAIAPDIVVLGSSHLEWLGENIFPNKKIMNCTVPLPVLADYLGIFEGYAKKHLYPQRVICLLDPQLIGYPNLSDKWLSIKEDTYSMLGRLGVRSEKIKEPVMPQAWFNIFSFSYFQESMKEFRATHGHIFSWNILLFKDGRWRIVAPSSRGIEKASKVLYNGKLLEALNKMKPDKELEDILEKFLRYLMGHHVRVTLCLLPVRPDIYKSQFGPQKREGALDFVKAEDYYRGLAQRLNLEIIGSYNPAACDLDGDDFINGDHIRYDVLEKILKQKGSKCSLPD